MALALDFVNGVNHGGVMFTPEGAADLRKRCSGQFLYQEHRYLARPDDGFGIAFFLQLRLLDSVLLRDSFLNRINRYTPILGMGQVFQNLLSHRQVDGGAG